MEALAAQGDTAAFSGSFVELFRLATPYIKMHQGKAVVFHVSSALPEQSKLFDDVMDDIATLAVLGVRPVVVVGISDQVDAAMMEAGLVPRYSSGHRIGDQDSLRIVQQVSGLARSRVEAALARGRASMSLSRGGSSGVDVVSSNMFYTAQPLGIRNGVDYGQTGEVRRVEVDRINDYLAKGSVVLLTSLGYSASGEVFNVPTKEVASRVAGALRASKLIYLTCVKLMQSHEKQEVFSEVKVVPSMRLAEAKALVAYHDESDDEADATLLTGGRPGGEDEAKLRMLALFRYCIAALEAGVNRAHIVPPLPGALLQELYTLDGAGTLIARDLYDGIRLAGPSDVSAIIDLITPLEASGILVARPRDELTRDVHRGFYYVLTRDDRILCCAMLKRYATTSAELGCLVTSRKYRKQGHGDAMLAFVERTAINAGVTDLFALSTHTMQWFMERGFAEVGLGALPERRQRLYNRVRASKIYMKPLASSRRVDAEELFWAEQSRSRNS